MFTDGLGKPAACIFGTQFDPEEEENVGNYLPVETVSHPRRIDTSVAPLWEPQTSYLFFWGDFLEQKFWIFFRKISFQIFAKG